jgi:lipopolysaccharide/colanic/teichoic acid biosynthesis glycosyltransferase
MSLVGPRPPLPYEVDCYRHWHWARLSAAKPGITGIWQVSGRSRVKFDDMVRMDLQYANSQSLWLDLKILLRTPQAMISGAGAR